MTNYSVKAGDTLYSLARKYGLSVEQLKAYNNLSSDSISIGQILRFPTSEQTKTDLSFSKDISDKEIERQEHIEIRQNPDYNVVSGDNLSKIAQKFNVEVSSIKLLNGLEKDNLKLNQTLKIPQSRIPKNIKNLNDVSKAMGVSKEFIQNLKLIEDGVNKATGKSYKDNEFHNTSYGDCEGVKTIGIGHVFKPGDKEPLSDKEVLETFTKDLLKMETRLEETIGKTAYKNLPDGMREALLDMVFNKGTSIITPEMIEDIRYQNYEAVINNMTDNRTATTRREISGLNKRRLLDISRAITDFNGNIPKSNIKTINKVYTRGIELLKEECRKNGSNFENIKAGFDEDIKKYFGNNYEIIFTE